MSQKAVTQSVPALLGHSRETSAMFHHYLMPHRSWLRWLSCSFLVLLVSCAQAPLSVTTAVAPTPSPIADDATDALTLNNQGVGKLQQQDYQGAIADFSAAIKLRPNLAEAYLGRGIAYSVSRNHKAAIADYDEALTLKPDLAEAYLYRACLLYTSPSPRD